MKRLRLSVLAAAAITPMVFATIGAAQTLDTPSPDAVADLSILNGQVADDAEMPTYIQLVVKDKYGKFKHHCGGSLISESWVLSAAHCFWDEDAIRATGQVKPLPTGFFYALHPLSKDERKIDRVIFPKEISHVGWPADLALVHVTQGFSTDARTILAAPKSPRPYGGLGTVWGKGNSKRVGPDRYELDDIDVYKSKLRRAQVTLNRAEFCGDPRKTPNMLCAEVPSKQGNSPASCTGDSGGPLTIYSQDPKRQIQIGLVSHADAPKGVEICGGQPTWYTDIGHWTNWIKSHVPDVRTGAYQLNPADGAPVETVPTPTPRPTLQCGKDETTGSLVPSADSPTLNWQPMRGATAGSKVSVEASKLTWTDPSKALGAVIVGECAWADALAASSLSGNGPVLLTDPAKLEDEVATELTRLNTKAVVIVGGEQAVSPGVEQALKAKGYQVKRVQGPSRTGTAAELAMHLQIAKKRKKVVLARAYPADGGSPSQAFADSLAAAYEAPMSESPILLSATTTLSPETERALQYIRPRNIHVLGGNSAISPIIEPAILKAAISNSLTRTAGPSRAATAAKLGHEYLNRAENPAQGVLVIEGQADDAWKVGFTFSSLAIKTRSVYALASGDELAPESVTLIKEAKAKGLPVRCVASEKACAKAQSL